MSRHIAIALAAALGMALCSASARAQFAPAVGPAIPVVAPAVGPAFDPPADPSSFAPGVVVVGKGLLTVPPPPAGWAAPAPAPAPASGLVAATGTGWHFFDWTADSNDPDNAIVATMSPDVCDQFYKSGLSATEGTVTSSPTMRTPSPGPAVLLLGGNRYGDPVYLGDGFEGDRKVCVIKLTKKAAPPPSANFCGNWTTGVGQFHAPRNLTLSQSGNSVTGSYVRTGNDGRTYTGNIDNGVVTGNVLKFHWTDGQDSGEGTFEMAANGQGFGGSYATLGGGSNNWDGWDRH